LLHPLLGLAQNLKGLLIGPSFSQELLPTAIPLHGLDLTGDMIPGGASVFSQSKTRQKYCCHKTGRTDHHSQLL
jgi:hypothetical protein